MKKKKKKTQKIMEKRVATAVCVLLVGVLVILGSERVEGRYLPTRSNNDKLDKLKDLLREVSASKQLVIQCKSVLPNYNLV